MMKTRICIAVTLALLAMQGVEALAQTPPGEVAASNQQGDPPGRVARLNYMAGTVTTEPVGASDWSYAQINRPLTTGDQLWNDANARSEMHIGSTAVRLGSSTALSILALDDRTAQLKVTQGTLSMRAREVAPGTQYEVDTPNAALAMTTPGDMRIDIAPDGRATTVTVRSGGVTAYGDGGSVQLAPGQQMTFEGTNLQQASANAAPDAFDQWAASRDAAEDRSISARYVSRDIPGYQDLDANGTWRNDPSYGAIWVPNAVSADWAPYRQGHWVWQAPWGWTWVDDAPWGFAPYHYGRWAYVGSQWAWVPGPMVASAPPPAYAPALVGFVGDGGGGVDWNVALTVGGIAAVGVAWFPLGPGEPWRPHHDGWSPRYYEQVNRNVYIDRSVSIHNTYVNYHAPRGLTALPANMFVRGQPVGRQPYAVDPSRWHNPRFFAGAPAIAPTHESFAPNARRADDRPPQGFARPVVATRQPPAEGAYAHRPQGFDDVHIVATHGPARAVITPHAPPQGAQPMQPMHAMQPQQQPAQQPMHQPNGVPRPPQNPQQFGGEPRVYRGGAEAQPHAPQAQQHIEHGAPNMPMQTAQPHAPQPQPQQPQQPMHHDAPPPRAQQAPQPQQLHQEQVHQQPQPQQFHQEQPRQQQVHQEPPHQQPQPQQHQQVHQEPPHPQPQQQQPQHADNEHHHG